MKKKLLVNKIQTINFICFRKVWYFIFVFVALKWRRLFPIQYCRVEFICFQIQYFSSISVEYIHVHLEDFKCTYMSIKLTFITWNINKCYTIVHTSTMLESINMNIDLLQLLLADLFLEWQTDTKFCAHFKLYFKLFAVCFTLHRKSKWKIKCIVHVIKQSFTY